MALPIKFVIKTIIFSLGFYICFLRFETIIFIRKFSEPSRDFLLFFVRFICLDYIKAKKKKNEIVIFLSNIYIVDLI